MLTQFCRQFEGCTATPPFAIGGTAPVESVPVIFRCLRVRFRAIRNRGRGARYQVTSQQNARTFLTVAGSKFGTGYHGVTITGEMQMRICAESLIGGVCNSFFSRRPNKYQGACG